MNPYELVHWGQPILAASVPAAIGLAIIKAVLWCRGKV